jgi:hypothetical protein
MFCKGNYKVVIVIGLLLHQSIVLKMFIVNALLNTGYLLEPRRLVHIMFFPLWKEIIVLISWGIRDI